MELRYGCTEGLQITVHKLLCTQHHGPEAKPDGAHDALDGRLFIAKISVIGQCLELMRSTTSSLHHHSLLYLMMRSGSYDPLRAFYDGQVVFHFISVFRVGGMIDEYMAMFVRW